jgi:hypothetical protein
MESDVTRALPAQNLTTTESEGLTAEDLRFEWKATIAAGTPFNAVLPEMLIGLNVKDPVAAELLRNRPGDVLTLDELRAAAPKIMMSTMPPMNALSADDVPDVADLRDLVSKIQL